jgi:virulence-associated protein VapD
MYAIAFDLDIEALKIHYHNQSYNNAYEDIRKVFEGFGFSRKQGSVYFGNDTVTPVTCVLAVQETHKLIRGLARLFAIFACSGSKSTRTYCQPSLNRNLS